MLIWQASSVIIRAMIYTCIQLFFVFKCVGVKEHRKLCFWLIVIYTMIFDSATTTIEILPLYQTSSMLQAAHLMIHAVNTFILFTIVGVFGNGYLPRNYLLAEIYYDFLSTVPIMPMFVVTDLLQQRFLPPGATDRYIEYPAGCVISVICMFIGLLQEPAFYYLFGKKVNDLLRKIPDNVCLFLFLASFAGFVTKQILLLKTNTYYINNPATLSYFRIATFDCNCSLVLATIAVIILLVFTAFQNRRLQYIQSLENRMLLDYYTNVSSLHSSIRSLRHDLSNHLTALSFMENAADPCRQALMSTSGGLVAAEAAGISDTAEISGGSDALEASGISKPSSSDTSEEASSSDAFKMPCASETSISGASEVSGGVQPPDDPGAAYRASLLGICDGISTQMTQQTAWQQIETDRLSSREKYEIYHYMMTVMDKHRIPASALSISIGAYGNVTEIAFAIRSGSGTAPVGVNTAEAGAEISPIKASTMKAGTALSESIPMEPGDRSAAADAGSTKNSAASTENVADPAAAGTGLSQTCAEPAEASKKRQKPLHLLLLRHDMMFRLIKIIAASHGGSAAWKKAGGVLTLSLTIPDQQ